MLQNDPDTGRIFSQPPCMAINFIQTRQKRGVNNPEILNAHAHDAKYVLSYLCQCHLLYNLHSLQKGIYIGETGRRLGVRFRGLLDVEKEDKTHLNRSLDTFICRINLNNISQSPTSPCIKEAQKAAKLWKRNLFFSNQPS